MKPTDGCYVEMMLERQERAIRVSDRVPEPRMGRSCGMLSPIRNPSATRARPEVNFIRETMSLPVYGRGRYITRLVPVRSIAHSNRRWLHICPARPEIHHYSQGPQLGTAQETGIQLRIHGVASDNRELALKAYARAKVRYPPWVTEAHTAANR